MNPFITYEIQPNDVEANRLGRISDAQKPFLISWVVGSILISPIMVVLFWSWILTRPTSPDMAQSGRCLALMISVIFPAIFIVLFRPLAGWRDLRDGRVLRVSGVPRLERKRGRRTHYYFLIHDLRFEVSSRLYEEAQLNQTGCHLYYLPHSEWLLSWERLTN